MINGRLQKFL